jgi:hypothetical protein
MRGWQPWILPGNKAYPAIQLASLNYVRPLAAAADIRPRADSDPHIPLQGSGSGIADYWPSMIFGVINPM